jgi:hypothetical protein
MQDGNIVYQGYAKESIAYFGKLGTAIRKDQNPPDIYMKILAVNYPKDKHEKKKIEFYRESYNKHMVEDVEYECHEF